jgi:predicted RNA-binding protein YlxR (DUF448 family)
LSAESDIPNLEQTEEDRRGHKSRERRCVATGEVRDPDRMVRYVLSPDGQVVADVYGKLPGRGVWVSANEALLRQAVKKGGFARGFKTKVAVDADTLVAHTRDQLRRHMLGQLTMARKGGRLVFGQTGVREPASRGDVALRIEASDGAPDGRGKLRTLSLATARELERPDPAVIGCLAALEIGNALGRDPVVHAAILVGPMVKAMKASAVRLSGFEPLVPSDWADAHHEISLEPPPLKRPPPKGG